MDFKINLTEALIEHMNKKRKSSLTLDINTLGGGCCDTFEALDITFGKPENPDLYHMKSIKEIDIYISRRSRVLAPVLKFDLQKKRFSNKIVVEGIALRN